MSIENVYIWAITSSIKIRNISITPESSFVFIFYHSHTTTAPPEAITTLISNTMD